MAASQEATKPELGWYGLSRLQEEEIDRRVHRVLWRVFGWATALLVPLGALLGFAITTWFDSSLLYQKVDEAQNNFSSVAGIVTNTLGTALTAASEASKLAGEVTTLQGRSAGQLDEINRLSNDYKNLLAAGQIGAAAQAPAVSASDIGAAFKDLFQKDESFRQALQTITSANLPKVVVRPEEGKIELGSALVLWDSGAQRDPSELRAHVRRFSVNFIEAFVQPPAIAFSALHSNTVGKSFIPYAFRWKYNGARVVGFDAAFVGSDATSADAANPAFADVNVALSWLVVGEKTLP
jgi:hypothetical protein